MVRLHRFIARATIISQDERADNRVHVHPEARRDHPHAGTSSTPTTSSSAGSPARRRPCCAASTSRSSPRTSTPATSSSSSTPRRSRSAQSKLGDLRYRHSGYPGGLSKRTVGELLETMPEHVIELAVKGMLPEEHPRPRQLKKLKVYAGPNHPHAAPQGPSSLRHQASRAVDVGESVTSPSKPDRRPPQGGDRPGPPRARHRRRSSSTAAPSRTTSRTRCTSSSSVSRS